MPSKKRSNYIEVKKHDNKTMKKFNKLRNKGQWFVWFHADWCGHCRAVDHDWDELVKNNTTSIKLAKVEESNIDNNKENIIGYPTFRLYTNSKQTEYNDGRDFESFMNFLKNNEVQPKSKSSSNNKNKMSSKQSGGSRTKRKSLKKSRKSRR